MEDFEVEHAIGMLIHFQQSTTLISLEHIIPEFVSIPRFPRTFRSTLFENQVYGSPQGFQEMYRLTLDEFWDILDSTCSKKIKLLLERPGVIFFQ